VLSVNVRSWYNPEGRSEGDPVEIALLVLGVLVLVGIVVLNAFSVAALVGEPPMPAPEAAPVVDHPADADDWDWVFGEDEPDERRMAGADETAESMTVADPCATGSPGLWSFILCFMRG